MALAKDRIGLTINHEALLRTILWVFPIASAIQLLILLCSFWRALTSIPIWWKRFHVLVDYLPSLVLDYFFFLRPWTFLLMSTVILSPDSLLYPSFVFFPGTGLSFQRWRPLGPITGQRKFPSPPAACLYPWSNSLFYPFFRHCTTLSSFPVTPWVSPGLCPPPSSPCHASVFIDPQLDSLLHYSYFVLFAGTGPSFFQSPSTGPSFQFWWPFSPSPGLWILLPPSA